MQADAVTVVVPTYNEVDNLGHLVASVRLHGYQVVVVDDGSPDGTGHLADELARADPAVKVIHRTSKQGLGRAYAAGFTRALGTGSRVVVEMDADFSHNPADLPRLIGAVEEGADLAIGSRYVPGGSTPDWPWVRKAISRGGNLYARFMLGLEVNDATAGFRAYRADLLGRLPYDSARASGYGFQVELAWAAHRAGASIVEVPIQFRDRELGTSKMGVGIVMEAMWLVTIWGLGRFFGRVRSPQ